MHRALPARRRTARPLGAVAALVLVPLLAAGCGDDGGDAGAEETETVFVDQDGNVIDDDGSEDDSDDDAGPALTEEQLAVVVLTQENLGDGWTGGPVEDDDDDEGTAPGCFDELGTISDSLDDQEVAEHDAEYSYGETGLPSVESGSVSFVEAAPVAEAFTQIKDVLSTCTTVTGADSNGTEWDVTVTYDDTVVSDATDEQVNYTAAGTLTDTEGNSFEISVHATLVRIGRNVIDITTTAFEDQSVLHDAAVGIGIDRLVSVIIDSEPSETTAPAPA